MKLASLISYGICPTRTRQGICSNISSLQQIRSPSKDTHAILRRTCRMSTTQDEVRLTQFSHGAGCGCKISPKNLEELLKSEVKSVFSPNLLVGHETKDDAAVYDIGNGIGIVSTTDFFMPIVDDPIDFGRIAATNAISDVYAMGGHPIMAIAILGFPINKLPLSVARKIIEGGRIACNEAGIPLSGGHSIDSPEPIFGLAVTGTVNINKIKRNSTATIGCKLYLTKPIGLGILTTAEKKGILKSDDIGKATEVMCQLNKIGSKLSEVEGIKAVTDVTGFGLLGHLIEICEGSGVMARLNFNDVPKLNRIDEYIKLGCCPGGTERNYSSYGSKVVQLDGYKDINELYKAILCDPQTSGGLLVAVEEGEAENKLHEILNEVGLKLTPIGDIRSLNESPRAGIFVVVE